MAVLAEKIGRCVRRFTMLSDSMTMIFQNEETILNVGAGFAFSSTVKRLTSRVVFEKGIPKL